MRKIFVLVAICTSVPVFGHHSHVVTHDVRNSVVLRGVVESIQVVNPHSEIALAVLAVGTHGISTEKCRVILDPPSVLKRNQLSVNLAVGRWLEITGFPSRATKRGDCEIWTSLSSIRHALGTAQ